MSLDAWTLPNFYSVSEAGVALVFITSWRNFTEMNKNLEAKRVPIFKYFLVKNSDTFKGLWFKREKEIEVDDIKFLSKERGQVNC